MSSWVSGQLTSPIDCFGSCVRASTATKPVSIEMKFAVYCHWKTYYLSEIVVVVVWTVQYPGCRHSTRRSSFDWNCSPGSDWVT